MDVMVAWTWAMVVYVELTVGGKETPLPLGWSGWGSTAPSFAVVDPTVYAALIRSL